MNLDQRLREASYEVRQAVAGRRGSLEPAGGSGAPGRRSAATAATVAAVVTALTITSLLVRAGGDPDPGRVGGDSTEPTAGTVIGQTTAPPIDTTLPAVDDSLPEAPYISPDLGLEPDPENLDSGLPFEPFLINARTGAIPVELHGDIRAAYDAASTVKLVPVQYHLALAVTPVDLTPVRSESGTFLIPGDVEALLHVTSEDLFLDHDPWATPDYEEWGVHRVRVSIAELPDGTEVAMFSVSVQDDGVWIKRVTVHFAPVEPGLALPLTEDTMRGIVALILDAIGGPGHG